LTHGIEFGVSKAGSRPAGLVNPSREEPK